MKINKTILALGLIATFLLFNNSATAQTQSQVLAVYGDSFNEPESAQKFRYLWNAKGEIGKAANYEKLTFMPKLKGYIKPNSEGKQTKGSPRGLNWMCSPGSDANRDSAKTARYLIGALTMENDSEGVVWVINGNLQHPYGDGPQDEVDLKIYVNDKLKFESKAGTSRLPTLFNAELGKLKKGDTIYLAVGPGKENKSDFFKLFCTIADLPANTKPSAPLNIIFPPADAPFPVVTVSGDARKGYASTLEHHNQLLTKENADIIFLGDSITAGWNNEIMKSKFAKYKTMQIGIGGDQTQNVLWRTENSTLDQINPKLIILMIGTNNISAGYTVNQIAAGNEAILKAIEKKNPKTKILLLGIFPRGKAISEPLNDKIKKINALLAKMADEKRVYYLDIGKELIETDGTISRKIFRDGLHLSKEGYVRWADAILPTVDKLMSGQY